MGKFKKYLMDYREREIMLAMGNMPLSGTFNFYWKDGYTHETVNPETIEDLIEFSTAEDTFEENEFQVLMKDILDSLTPRESKILRLRFGINMVNEYTLEQVASIFNVTRERIRQIEAKALRKMRHPSRSKKLMGEPETLWDIATEPPPERDEDEEWGWSAYEEERYQRHLIAWKERTNAARVKLEEARNKLIGGRI